jgi:hypothetical protein
MQEEFKNTNGVIRTHKSKGRQHNDQQKKEKEQTTIYKTLQINLKIG